MQRPVIKGNMYGQASKQSFRRNNATTEGPGDVAAHKILASFPNENWIEESPHRQKSLGYLGIARAHQILFQGRCRPTHRCPVAIVLVAVVAIPPTVTIRQYLRTHGLSKQSHIVGWVGGCQPRLRGSERSRRRNIEEVQTRDSARALRCSQ